MPSPPASYLLAALLPLAALAGCGGSEEPDSTTPVSQRELAAMVLSQDRLGAAAEGLVLDEDSGPQDNRAAALDTVDPNDGGRALATAGRVRGFALGYTRPGASTEPGVVDLQTTVELFRSEKEASDFVHAQADAYEFHLGESIGPGVRLVEATRFDVAVGDEARGLTAVVRGGGVRVFGTVVAFRHDRVVGAVALGRLGDEDETERVVGLAKALAERIEGVLAGTVPADPVLTAAPGPENDPEPLVLAAADFPTLDTKLAHEGPLANARVRLYVREFDVTGGSLGRSKVFYLRTLAQAFGDPATSRQHTQYLRSEAGARELTQGFLGAWLGADRAAVRRVTSRPLDWGGKGLAAIEFSFRAPNGRMKGVYLSVASGRFASSVTVVGREAQVRTADVRALEPLLTTGLAR
jgi:hypothetical protein